MTKSSLIEKLAFPESGSDLSLEAADFEYEVEIYLKGFDIEQIKSMATTHCSQEQWGIYIPKTAANASGGSIRVRKSVSVDDETKFELTTKTEAGDQGKFEHEIDTDAAQFEQFKRLADQGLIKTRYEFPGEVNGVQFKYEVDVFFDARGNLVPWVKIDAELPEGTVFDKSTIPLTFEEIIIITPELKGTDEVLKARVAKLYNEHFRAMNVYVGTDAPPIEEAAA